MDFKQIIRKKIPFSNAFVKKTDFDVKKKKRYIQSVDWAVKTVNKNIRVWLNRNIFNYIRNFVIICLRNNGSTCVDKIGINYEIMLLYTLQMIKPQIKFQ